MKGLKKIILGLLVFVMAMSVTTTFVGCGKKEDTSTPPNNEQPTQPTNPDDQDPTVTTLSKSESLALIDSAASSYQYVNSNNRLDNEVYFLSSGANKTYGLSLNYSITLENAEMGKVRALFIGNSYRDTTRSALQTEDYVNFQLYINNAYFTESFSSASFSTTTNKTAQVDLRNKTLEFTEKQTEADTLGYEFGAKVGDNLLMGIARILKENSALLQNSNTIVSGSTVNNITTITLNLKDLLNVVSNINANNEILDSLANFNSIIGEDDNDFLGVFNDKVNTNIEVSIQNGKFIALNLRQTHYSEELGLLDISFGGNIESKNLNFKDRNYGDFMIMGVTTSEDDLNYLQKAYSEDDQPVIEDGFYYLITPNNHSGDVYPVIVENGEILIPSDIGGSNSYGSDNITILNYLPSKTNDVDYNNIVGKVSDSLYLLKATKQSVVASSDGVVNYDDITSFADVNYDNVYCYLQKIEKSSRISDGYYALTSSSTYAIQGFDYVSEAVEKTTETSPILLLLKTNNDNRTIKITTEDGDVEYIVEEYPNALLMYDIEPGNIKGELWGIIMPDIYGYSMLIEIDTLKNNESYKIKDLDTFLETFKTIQPQQATQDTIDYVLNDSNAGESYFLNMYIKIINDKLYENIVNDYFEDTDNRTNFINEIKTSYDAYNGEGAYDSLVQTEELEELSEEYYSFFESYVQSAMESILPTLFETQLNTLLGEVFFREELESYLDDMGLTEEVYLEYGTNQKIETLLALGDKEVFVKSLINSYGTDVIESQLIKSALSQYLQEVATELYKKQLHLLKINNEYSGLNYSYSSYKKLTSVDGITENITAGIYQIKNVGDEHINLTTFSLLKDANGNSSFKNLDGDDFIFYNPSTMTITLDSSSYTLLGIYDNELVFKYKSDVAEKDFSIIYYDIIFTADNQMKDIINANLSNAEDGLYKFDFNGPSNYGEVSSFLVEKDGVFFSTYASNASSFIYNYNTDLNELVLNHEFNSLVIKFYSTKNDNGKTIYYGFVKNQSSEGNIYQNLAGVVEVSKISVEDSDLLEFVEDGKTFYTYFEGNPYTLDFSVVEDNIIALINGEEYTVTKKEAAAFYLLELTDDTNTTIDLKFLIPVLSNGEIQSLNLYTIDGIAITLLNAGQEVAISDIPGGYYTLINTDFAELSEIKFAITSIGTVITTLSKTYDIDNPNNPYDLEYSSSEKSISYKLGEDGTIYKFILNGKTVANGTNVYTFKNQANEYIFIKENTLPINAQLISPSISDKTFKNADSYELYIKYIEDVDAYTLRFTYPQIDINFSLYRAGNYLFALDNNAELCGILYVSQGAGNLAVINVIDFAYNGDTSINTNNSIFR